MSKITANVSKIKTLRSNNATNYNNFVSEMQSISLEFLKNEKHMQEQLLLINSQISQMETLIEELNYKIKRYEEENSNIIHSNLYRDAEIYKLENNPIKKTIEKSDGTKEDYYEVDNEKINKIKNEIENDKQRYSLNEGKILNAKNLKDKILFMLSKLQSIQYNIDRCITLYESFIEKNRTLIGFAENEAAHNNNKLDSVLDALTKYTSCDGFEFLRQSVSMGDMVLDNNQGSFEVKGSTSKDNKKDKEDNKNLNTKMKNKKSKFMTFMRHLELAINCLSPLLPPDFYDDAQLSELTGIVLRVDQNDNIEGSFEMSDGTLYISLPGSHNVYQGVEGNVDAMSHTVDILADKKINNLKIFNPQKYIDYLAASYTEETPTIKMGIQKMNYNHNKKIDYMNGVKTLNGQNKRNTGYFIKIR